MFVSGAGGRTLSSALILVPTVNMADPQTGGLPPRVTLGRGFNGAQMNKYMNKSESREIIQQTATVVGSYSKQYSTLKLQFLHTQFCNANNTFCIFTAKTSVFLTYF